eukprot:7947095-Lingulodinium_polyedra.AAC.1
MLSEERCNGEQEPSGASSGAMRARRPATAPGSGCLDRNATVSGREQGRETARERAGTRAGDEAEKRAEQQAGNKAKGLGGEPGRHRL